MSSDDRPATRASKDRWSNVRSFWKERQRGPYDRDFTEWRMNMGLTPRTARENYWCAGETLGVIRIVYEKGLKYWEYCLSGRENETATAYMHRKDAEKKPKLSAKGKDWFERCRIKEEMMAGPCKDECSVQDKDCRYCDVYTGLHRILPLRGE